MKSTVAVATVVCVIAVSALAAGAAGQDQEIFGAYLRPARKAEPCRIPAGARFISVDEMDAGIGPGGPVRGHWFVRFAKKSFNWTFSDMSVGGRFECDGIRVTGYTLAGTFAGTFDTETGQLEWQGHKYAITGRHARKYRERDNRKHPGPAETPEPERNPKPVPEPQRKPAPRPEPDPTPVPEPRHTPDPEPERNPKPVSEPQRKPDPTITPDPTRTPDPKQDPVPEKVPVPAPKPARPARVEMRAPWEIDPIGKDDRERRGCTTHSDCVITCHADGSCCGDACGCSNALNREFAARLDAHLQKHCRGKGSTCPAVACRMRGPFFALCRDGMCESHSMDDATSLERAD